MAGHIWVIELKIGEIWSPLLDSIYNIPGVHYIRKDAREAKQRMLDVRQYKTRVKYRVRKYTSG